MTKRSDQTLPGAAGFEDELAALRRRLSLTDSQDREALAQSLETAYEELHVADEEVRVQQDQISGLLEGERLLRWQHDRLLAVLPVPVLTTDRRGIVRVANAAAAVHAGMRVDVLLDRPVFTLFAIEDRAELRQALRSRGQHAESVRLVVTGLRRGRPAVRVEAFLTAAAAGEGLTTWMLLSPYPQDDGGRHRLAAGLARLAGLTTTITSTRELLGGAAAICRETLDEGAEVSILLGDPLSPEAVGSTGQSAQALDGAQVEAGEGPGADARAEGLSVVVSQARTDPRWPRLARRPGWSGGVVSAPLRAGHEVVGVMNVYTDAGPQKHLVESVELLASTMGSMLVELGMRHEVERLAESLQEALNSRATIDQAKGIVMAHRGCSPDEAFEHLVRLSSAQHVKLRELAKSIVDRAAP